MAAFSLSFLLKIIAGGFLGLISSSLSFHFGYRSADRLPGESRWPECVFCFRPLKVVEIIPLFSWLLRRPFFALACPCGKQKGLWFQPTVELTGFILGATAASFSSWSLSFAPLCIGLGTLPAIALVDLLFGIIPDGLNLFLGFCGFLWLAASGRDVSLGLVTAAGLLAFSLFIAIVYSKWRGREVLGLGDVKFFAAAGFWLPITLIPWFMFMAGFLGGIFGLIWKRYGGSKEFPFAPALCTALAIVVLYHIAYL